MQPFYKAFVKLSYSFYKPLKTFSKVFLESFYNAFYKTFVINSFSKTLFRFNIYFSWIYNRNFADIKEMPTSAILQGRCVEPGVSFNARNKFFLVGFSLTFTRFLHKSKDGLNTSLWTLRLLINILMKESTFSRI